MEARSGGGLLSSAQGRRPERALARLAWSGQAIGVAVQCTSSCVSPSSNSAWVWVSAASGEDGVRPLRRQHFYWSLPMAVKLWSRDGCPGAP